jgi:hypothetical protein
MIATTLGLEGRRGRELFIYPFSENFSTRQEWGMCSIVDPRGGSSSGLCSMCCPELLGPALVAIVIMRLTYDLDTSLTSYMYRAGYAKDICRGCVSRALAPSSFCVRDTIGSLLRISYRENEKKNWLSPSWDCLSSDWLSFP